MKAYITPNIKVKVIEMETLLAAQSGEPTQDTSEIVAPSADSETTITEPAAKENNSFGTWDE